MTRPHSRLSALAWNLGSQGGAALCGLLLVKLSVSAFSVSAYGIAALLLGLQLLARNTTLYPVLCLAIYTTPAEGAQHGLGWLYRATARCLRLAGVFALPAFLLMAWGLRVPPTELLPASALLGTLLLSEGFKSARFNLLHCQDRNRRYALWILADAAVKPLSVFLAIRGFTDRSALTLVGAQVAGSLAVWLATAADREIRRMAAEHRSMAPPPKAWTWIAAHQGFLLPLVGVGLAGWVTGLSDRYLVNHFLGAAPAGLYAGIYGLFSAPFLIAGGAALLAVRPALLNLEREGRREAWRRLHFRSLLVLTLGMTGLGLFLFLIREPLVRLVLAPAYRQAIPVVPGLLLGNGILAVGTLVEQAFYVRRRTGLVLLKQATGSACALAFVALALPRWGLAGAGWACPFYTGVECLAGLALAFYLASQGGDQLPA